MGSELKTYFATQSFGKCGKCKNRPRSGAALGLPIHTQKLWGQVDEISGLVTLFCSAGKKTFVLCRKKNLATMSRGIDAKVVLPPINCFLNLS